MKRKIANNDFGQWNVRPARRNFVQDVQRQKKEEEGNSFGFKSDLMTFKK